LDALTRNFPGGHQIKQKFGQRVRGLALKFHQLHDGERDALEGLISETVAFRRELEQKLGRGRDRLLELCACRPEPANRILEQIGQVDRQGGLERFMARLFNHYGIEMEETLPRTWQLKTNSRFGGFFPGFRGERMNVTFHRPTATANEHLHFLTWDHPMVTDALDLLLGSSTGNCALTIQSGGDVSGIVLETIFVLECVSPAHLQAERFLPPTPLRVVLDQDGELEGESLSALKGTDFQDLPPDRVGRHLEGLGVWVNGMIPRAEKTVRAQAGGIIAEALDALKRELNTEIERLSALSRINPNIRAEEIDLLAREREVLGDAVAKARIRLEALRVILGPANPLI
jgi:ATP-dependent helicase HepA